MRRGIEAWQGWDSFIVEAGTLYRIDFKYAVSAEVEDLLAWCC